MKRWLGILALLAILLVLGSFRGDSLPTSAPTVAETTVTTTETTPLATTEATTTTTEATTTEVTTTESVTEQTAPVKTQRPTGNRGTKPVTKPPTAPPTAPPTTPPTEPAIPKTLVNAPYLSQADFPTGCESATAVMLLRFWGVDIDIGTFVDTHLEKGRIIWDARGMVAPHPADKFVGDPRSTAAYGCFAPVIVRALQSAAPSLSVVDETGATLDELCAQYIDQGFPVAVWATMGMSAILEGSTWTTPQGEKFTWPSGEHCLLLVGYDAKNYYFHDPLKRANTAYSRAVVQQRYIGMGAQAVGIWPPEAKPVTEPATEPVATEPATP